MSDRSNRTGVFEMPQNPGLADLFRVELRALMLKIRTHTVGTVIAYDPTSQKVSVSVDILKVIKDNFTPPTVVNPNPTKIQPPTTLTDIPVAWPRTNSGYLTFALNPGDTGELHVQDRSLDQWLRLGIATDPVSAFTHSLEGSVFHPTLHSDNNPLPPTDQTATVLEGTLVKLGALAALGVARASDGVGASSSLTTWANAVEAALAAAGSPILPAASWNTLGLPSANALGAITSASSKVRSE